MTTESTVAPGILHLNMCPTFNYALKSEVAIMLHVVAMLHLLHGVTNEEQHKKLLCNESRKCQCMLL